MGLSEDLDRIMQPDFGRHPGVLHYCFHCSQPCLCTDDSHCRHRCQTPDVPQIYRVRYAKVLYLTRTVGPLTLAEALAAVEHVMRQYEDDGYSLESIEPVSVDGLP